MRCPVCLKAGTPSKLYSGQPSLISGPTHDPRSAVPPGASAQTWWDEQGALHVHDNSRLERQVSCSNGHQLIWRGSPPCLQGDFDGAEEWYWRQPDPDDSSVVRVLALTAAGELIPKKKPGA